MHNTKLIEKQIDNCRSLLKVFKEERESYTDNAEADLRMVMRMLNRKKVILASFQQQKELMSSIREQGHQDDEKQQKMLLRELGKVLEQLLVIDQENEILLRDQLRKTPDNTKAGKEKLALKPELPFCPQLREQPSQQVLKKTAIDESPALTKMNRFSRMKLKAYGA